MKKIITLCSLLILSVSAIYAQSFAFFRGETQLPSGAEITVNAVTTTPIPGELEIPANLSAKNLTNSTLDVRMRQTITSHTGAGDNLINWCFNVCSNVPITTTTLDRTSSIAANSFEENFHTNLIVYPGEFATVTARYDVFPQGSLDSYSIIVHFVYNQDSPTTVGNISTSDKFNMLQNDGTVSFIYAIDRNMLLEIFDLTGKKTAQYQLLSNERKFILPKRLTKGIYIYAVRNGNSTVTVRKFTIQ
ncbi:MAG: T9SS type A sorting domain-containing protein [Paludibacter sp.]|jgi:hypothetical protein|nr:T9SS type A sorting domain-containing protein [Paludibacter sp.]